MGRPCVVGAGELRIDESKKIFTASSNGKSIVVKEGASVEEGAPLVELTPV
jgi:hypothetical protein